MASTKKIPKFFDYNVYVACSLTNAPKEFREEVESFKKDLSQICNVMMFKGLGNFDPHEIYLWDIHECVMKSDLLVAICDHPSIGLGYEVGTQVEVRKKPCLAIGHENSLVTEFIWDIRQPGYEFRRYKDLHKDGLDMVIEKLKKMQKTHKLSKQKTSF